MPLQVARDRVQIPTEDEARRLRREFDARHYIRVPSFLAPDLMRWTRDRLASAAFDWQIHDALDPPARNLHLVDVALRMKVRTLFNDERLFAAVEQVTGCDRIGCCVTNVYYLDASPDARDTWHGDVDGNRLVAMSVNIGGPYAGGTLQIRERASHRLVSDVDNNGDGSAVLFRIDDGLEHFVTPVTAGRRLAIAGWFQREPGARELLGL